MQDLYLSGKKEEAGAALPDALIDMLTLAGPVEAIRDRVAAYREAGVGTLAVTPMAFDFGGRIAQLRQLAEIAL